MTKKIIKLPFGAGQLAVSRHPGSLAMHWEREGKSNMANAMYMSNLRADLIHNGRHQGYRDLGSGLVTNVGVMALANDFAWASPAGAPNSLFANTRFHSTGTGVVAASVSDIQLGAPIATLAVPVGTGTQVYLSTPNSQRYQTVSTLTYDAGGPYAVTEWGLFNGATLSSTLGSPFTATTALNGAATGTPYTPSSTSVRGQQQNIVRAGVTDAYGLILTNTNNTLTVPAWYKATDGTAATTPGATEAFTIRPVMWDRKQFAAINVSNGDAIQFTWTLTMVHGG